MRENIRFCAPCLFGIEGILSAELKRMNAQNVIAQNGRVFFEGDYDLLAYVNINSRYAERIQIVMAEFKAKSFEDLYQGVKSLSWEKWIGKKDKFPVKGWSLNSQLHSIPDCQSIIKKAIVDRLSKAYNIKWFDETDALYQIQFTILKDEVVILIDTTGEGLHKRGYRKQAGLAPIKETLAAAIGDLARVRLASRVFDPCCGSGTLLIESLLSAYRIAPGINRRFISETWNNANKNLWKEQREISRQGQYDDNRCVAWGGDIEDELLKLTRDNSSRAGISKYITTANQSLEEFKVDNDGGVVLCNPPYGERMLELKQSEDLYKQMGQVFLKKSGWSYYIISPHKEFESLFGRTAKRRRKLYNGTLECQLYMYF